MLRLSSGVNEQHKDTSRQVTSDIQCPTDVKGGTCLTMEKHITRHSHRIESACQFIDSALGQNHIHMDLTVPVEDFLQQYYLRVRRAPGNGHCLLYSWAMAINTSVEVLKQQLLQEFTNNQTRYANAGIQPAEINKYLQSGTYTLDAVDAVADMLCNATGVTAFIIGQKFDYSNPCKIRHVPNVMEIRKISSHIINSPQILLLKTLEHYDCIA